MKNSLMIVAGLVVLTVQPVPVFGSLANELIGKPVIYVANEFFGQTSRLVGKKSSLAAENEAKIREIAEEMGIAEKFTVYGGEFNGSPFCAGNRLYFSDAFFESNKDNPDVIRFVVGHELGHFAHYHNAKVLISLILPLILVGYLMAGYIDGTEVGEQFNEWLANLVFFIPEGMRSHLGLIVTKVLLLPSSLGTITANGLLYPIMYYKSLSMRRSARI